MEAEPAKKDAAAPSGPSARPSHCGAVAAPPPLPPGGIPSLRTTQLPDLALAVLELAVERPRGIGLRAVTLETLLAA
jgi:hypothetical protein